MSLYDFISPLFDLAASWYVTVPPTLAALETLRIIALYGLMGLGVAIMGAAVWGACE